jgi:hypothetical protein
MRCSLERPGHFAKLHLDRALPGAKATVRQINPGHFQADQSMKALSYSVTIQGVV